MSQGLANKFTGERVIPRDLSKPVLVHTPYAEYPKLVYHPTKKHPLSVSNREKAIRHNQLHPEKPELVPDLVPVTLEVKSLEEEKKALAAGYSLQAPHPYPDEEIVEEVSEPVLPPAPSAVHLAKPRVPRAKKGA